MVTFHLVMSKYWIGKGKEQYQIIQFTQKLVCTRSAVVTINGAIGGGIVGTVYRYVGSSSQSSQICLGSIARKSFIFSFLLAPEEGLFSNRNIGFQVTGMIEGFSSIFEIFQSGIFLSQSPSLFPFLPIPKLFRRLLRRLISNFSSYII